MNFVDFDFNFNFFLLQLKKIYTLKLIVALLRHDIYFQSFFPSFFKEEKTSIQRM